MRTVYIVGNHCSCGCQAPRVAMHVGWQHSRRGQATASQGLQVFRAKNRVERLQGSMCPDVCPYS